MNRKFSILILSLIILLLFAGTAMISANSNSSNSKTVKVDNVSFTLPQQYQSGNLTNNSYVIKNVFEFGILSLGDNRNLGSNLIDELYYSNLNSYEYTDIDGHYAFVTNSYKSSVKHNVTSIFFNTGDKIYLLSYNGNNLTPVIEDVIGSTPKSEMSRDEFVNLINSTYEEYAADEDSANEAYDYEKSYEDYSNSQTHHHRINFIWII
ncbi:MAG: hypothetical protein ACI37V_02065 [Methanobrevibacter sp.]